jgi:hypothetical protein
MMIWKAYVPSSGHSDRIAHRTSTNVTQDIFRTTDSNIHGFWISGREIRWSVTAFKGLTLTRDICKILFCRWYRSNVSILNCKFKNFGVISTMLHTWQMNLLNPRVHAQHHELNPIHPFRRGRKGVETCKLTLCQNTISPGQMFGTGVMVSSSLKCGWVSVFGRGPV